MCCRKRVSSSTRTPIFKSIASVAALVNWGVLVDNRLLAQRIVTNDPANPGSRSMWTSSLLGQSIVSCRMFLTDMVQLCKCGQRSEFLASCTSNQGFTERIPVCLIC